MSATLSPQATAESTPAPKPDHRTLPRKTRFEKWLLGSSACHLIEIPYPTLLKLKEAGLVRVRQLPTERSPRYHRDDLLKIAAESISGTGPDQQASA